MKNSVKTFLKFNRSLAATTMLCAAALAISACSTAPKTDNPNGYAQGQAPAKSTQPSQYNDSELVTAISDHLGCLLYTSPSPRDLSTSRMPSSA